MLDYSHTKFPPFDLQRIGIEALVKWDDKPAGRVHGGCFALFDEMGVGKSKQVIDAAQFLFQKGLIDNVVIIAPAGVRSVWFDDELGEIMMHAWSVFSHHIEEYHQRVRYWQLRGDDQERWLRWTITNYEFVRREDRKDEVKTLCTERTLLVLDESSAIKTYNSDQTLACMEIREACGCVTLLNGTPIANNPGDLFTQAAVMHRDILKCRNWFVFRARYAVMGGWQNKQIIKWQNLEELQQLLKPYVLRRETADSLELPKKHDPIQIPVTLSDKSWKIYTEMRNDMVAWLDQQTMSMATQAGVKAMRLAQIVSGFAGGIDALPENLAIDSDDDKFDQKKITDGLAEIGTEKLDAFLLWLEKRMIDNDWNHKVIVWSRFRPEVQRTLAALRARWPHMHVGAILGGQKKDERRAALRLLNPRTTPTGPVVVVGTPASGSMGLNCVAAWTMVYLSNDFNLKTRLQSMARIHRAGQEHECFYYDFTATGPKGQKTVDHIALKALGNKENLATWTAAAWRRELEAA